MVRKLDVAGVICIATWVIEVPLAASVAHLESSGPAHVSAGPAWWFLAALSVGLTMRAVYPNFLLKRSAGLVALIVNVAATLLGRGALQPACYIVMGIATGAGFPAAAGLMETLLDSAWTGRLVAATVSGITLAHWGLDLLREVLPPVAVFLLVLAFLIAGWGALSRTARGARSRAPAAAAAMAPASVWLFVFLFATIGGISARFMLGTAAALTLGDVLIRLLFLGGLAAGCILLKRGITLRIAVAAAALLVAAFLAHQLGWVAAVPLLSAGAFGILEPIPWFVLARLAAAGTNARPWAGAAAALFVLRFGIAIPMTARIDEHMLVLMGLPGALAILLALVLVPDLFAHGSPVALSESAQPAKAVGQAEVAATLAAPPPPPPVNTGRLLERYYGDRLSQRELEIGSLAVAGTSTREIAERLFLTENTVKTHLKNVYRKTGAENRHDLYRKLIAAAHAETGTGQSPEG